VNSNKLVQSVRSQIDAVKGYLVAEGFSDVEDSPGQKPALEAAHVDNVHTFLVTWEGRRPILRLSYAWLRERDANAVAPWRSERNIAEQLKPCIEMRIVGDYPIGGPIMLEN